MIDPGWIVILILTLILLAALAQLGGHIARAVHRRGVAAQRQREERAALMSRGEDRAKGEDVRSGVKTAAPEGVREPAELGSAASERRTEGGTGANALAMSAEELAQVRAAIAELVRLAKAGERATKEGVIRAAFGATKGASERYKRASVIYDALLAPPPEVKAAPQFPARDEKQQAVRDWIEGREDKQPPAAKIAPATGG